MEKARAFALSPIFSYLSKNSSPVVPGYDYLTGFRGYLTISSFIWVFLVTFVPTTVKDSANDDGPGYQIVLRKVLSVIFWNETLLYSSFILLSARVACLPFLISPTTATFASSIFRRSANLFLPVAVALAIIKLISSQTGYQYIWDYKTLTHNISIDVPYELPNALTYFNAIFNLFWTTTNFASQAGSLAFPSQTLWIVNVLYSQSYTIYMTMIVIPYTRPRWRVQAFVIFIATAWWVQSWAWYSITGLLLADAIGNMDFKTKSNRGIQIYRSIRIPSWTLYGLLLAVGLMLQYLWTAWRPEFENYELVGHTGLYYTGGVNTQYDLKQPQARDDNYLIVLGFFLLLETSDILQMIFSNTFFMYLGRRSYSFFLMQSIIIYTVGIKLFVHLVVDRAVASSGAVVVCLITCLPIIVLSAEVMHRVVDQPMRRAAVVMWRWLRE
ncbi:MAG: hypothetical protein M1818_005624 [Claussenomyces sp. TS43310]|nr:MAG: hypothetical protein M1818_005624 [Claussenomyces sp. TS43310]